MVKVALLTLQGSDDPDVFSSVCKAKRMMKKLHPLCSIHNRGHYFAVRNSGKCIGFIHKRLVN